MPTVPEHLWIGLELNLRQANPSEAAKIIRDFCAIFGVSEEIVLQRLADQVTAEEERAEQPVLH